jgi:hypothetical protein
VQNIAEAKKVMLNAQFPSINKIDNALNILAACEHLSLSTNAIDKLAPLPGIKVGTRAPPRDLCRPRSRAPLHRRPCRICASSPSGATKSRGLRSSRTGLAH